MFGFNEMCIFYFKSSSEILKLNFFIVSAKNFFDRGWTEQRNFILKLFIQKKILISEEMSTI